MEAMGWLVLPSSCTKMGRMKFEGVTMDSRMAERKVSVRLLRLGRDGRSCGVVVQASEHHQVLSTLPLRAGQQICAVQAGPDATQKQDYRAKRN